MKAPGLVTWAKRHERGQGGAGGKKSSTDEACARLGDVKETYCCRKALPEVGLDVSGCLGGGTRVGEERGHIGVL
jgi:hypothetical protein